MIMDYNLKLKGYVFRLWTSLNEKSFSKITEVYHFTTVKPAISQ